MVSTPERGPLNIPQITTIAAVPKTPATVDIRTDGWVNNKKTASAKPAIKGYTPPATEGNIPCRLTPRPNTAIPVVRRVLAKVKSGRADSQNPQLQQKPQKAQYLPR